MVLGKILWVRVSILIKLKETRINFIHAFIDTMVII